MIMNISPSGIEFIKSWEKLRLNAYLDAPSTSIWTIGYGHTKGVYANQTISVDQAKQFLNEDLAIVESMINYYCKNVDLSQNQFDALCSLVFNVGAGTIFTKVYNNGYKKGSSLYNLLLAGEIDKAGDHFTDFVMAGGQKMQGLVNRRKSEQNLFKKKAF